MAAPKQAPLTQPMERIQHFWAGLSSQQRIYLGVGLAVTIAVLAIFTRMIATPDFKPLLNGLEPADAQTVSAQLDAKKIPYQLSPDGKSISVPSEQVDAARLEVASHDTTHSGRMGFEIFDKVSWGQTEFDERVNYQRALEGELERTIQTMSDVKSARVHLVMATDSVFLDRERSAKASVTLRLKRGNLSREQLSAISRLVAGAVDELKPGDIAIVDADSNQSLGSSNGDFGSSGDAEQELTRRLISTLAPVVGTDHIRASVNVEYETGSSEESQEKYDPAVSAPLVMQHSEEGTGPGALVGGIPGTSSNVPSARPAVPTVSTLASIPAPKVAAGKDAAGKDISGKDAAAGQDTVAAGRDPGQSSRTDSVTYGVNKITRHVIEPAGRIHRITAALLVDDIVEHKQVKGKWIESRRKRLPEDLKMISELAQAAIGFDTTRGDVISVQNLTFDHTDAAELVPPTAMDKVKSGLNDYASVIRYAALLVLFVLAYLLMIRPLQKRAFAAPNPLLAGARSPLQTRAGQEAAALPLNQSSAAQRSQVLKKQLADFVLAEPETSTSAVRAWLGEEAV